MPTPATPTTLFVTAPPVIVLLMVKFGAAAVEVKLTLPVAPKIQAAIRKAHIVGNRQGSRGDRHVANKSIGLGERKTGRVNLGDITSSGNGSIQDKRVRDRPPPRTKLRKWRRPVKLMLPLKTTPAALIARLPLLNVVPVPDPATENVSL